MFELRAPPVTCQSFYLWTENCQTWAPLAPSPPLCITCITWLQLRPGPTNRRRVFATLLSPAFPLKKIWRFGLPCPKFFSVIYIFWKQKKLNKKPYREENFKGMKKQMLEKYQEKFLDNSTLLCVIKIYQSDYNKCVNNISHLNDYFNYY